MPISMGTHGNVYVIQKITGSAEVKQHLNALGFNPGTEVTVVSRLDGNVILAVKDARIAINEEQARHILV